MSSLLGAFDLLEKLKRTTKNQTGVYISFNTNYSRILCNRALFNFYKTKQLLNAESFIDVFNTPHLLRYTLWRIALFNSSTPENLAEKRTKTYHKTLWWSYSCSLLIQMQNISFPSSGMRRKQCDTAVLTFTFRLHVFSPSLFFRVSCLIFAGHLVGFILVEKVFGKVF